MKTKNIKRVPVVAIMGHVDHGKSTLLDYIHRRKTERKEAGGITQHIDAYEIIHKGSDGQRKITFIDTPGHEAFLSMRGYGASIADIVILVVAADDGVKEQTKESIKIIQDLGVPFIVAINKIDKNNADIMRTKQSLAEENILLEGFGGNIPNAEISAKTGEGVDNLLDLILLLSDLEGFEGDIDKKASGFVLESHINSNTGMSAQLVIKDGSISIGDYVSIEGVVSKIKSIQDYLGSQIKKASFSSPINITGLSKLPKSGSFFESFDTKKEAEETASKTNTDYDVLKSDSVDEEEEYIPIMIKADVLGTLEAIEQEIKKIKSEKVNIKIIQKGVGNISESDAKIASGVKNPIVIGFNVKIDRTAKETLDRYGIKPQIFDVIYKIVEYLEPEVRKREPKKEILEEVAYAKVIRLFSKTGRKQVVGADIKKGEIKEKDNIKILRNNEEIGEGIIKEMQVEKKKVKIVECGSKAGLTIDSRTTISVSDVISVMKIVQK